MEPEEATDDNNLTNHNKNRAKQVVPCKYTTRQLLEGGKREETGRNWKITEDNGVNVLIVPYRE